MKQIIIRIFAASVAFVIGVVCVWEVRALYQQDISATQFNEVPPVVDVRTVMRDEDWDLYNEPLTTDSLQDFWTEFQSAVRADDKEKLFKLTLHYKFTWSEENLKLGFKSGDLLYSPGSGGYGCFYAFKSYDEFLRNYPILFSKNIKEKVLNGTLYGNPEDNSYYIRWTDGAVYKLMFGYIKDIGYKFVGLQIYPL